MAALKVAGSRPRSFRPQHWLMMKKQSRGVGGIRLKKVLSLIQRPKHIVSCRFTACRLYLTSSSRAESSCKIQGRDFIVTIHLMSTPL